MRRPSNLMSPFVTFSRPAVIRRSVVLPQPDGPSNTTKRRSPIAKLTSSMMVVEPYFLPICS